MTSPDALFSADLQTFFKIFSDERPYDEFSEKIRIRGKLFNIFSLGKIMLKSVFVLILF